MTILIRELSVRVEIDARSSPPPVSTAQAQTQPKIQQRQALQQALRQCQEYKRW
ncbi:hypothetical protein [Iodobacter fluviatilis]|uniref:hypothetical protein n=1 Tax=Iodobacter fluviatilis TaxID=537 RepID=UPI00165E0919|nr:hypothetical protein [Iodobacter fluviatilis]